MPLRKPKAVDAKLEKVTENLLDEMIENGSDTEEYPLNLTYLERVTAIRNATRRQRMNPNNLVLSGTNLFGILIIVIYEQKHVLTSKAQAMLLKSK